MRFKLDESGRATLPSHWIKTSNITLASIPELEGAYLSGTSIFVFAYQEAIPIMTVLHDRGIECELEVLVWHPVVMDRIRNMTFINEQEVCKYLIVIEGSPVVDTVNSVKYRIVFPPTVKSGVAYMRLKDKGSPVLAPLYGPYDFTGGMLEINYKFLQSGVFHMDIEHDMYNGGLDIAVGDLLADYKKLKIEELDKHCNEAILAGFTSFCLGSEHTYDFDYEAQINFSGTLNGIVAGMIDGYVFWKTREKGPLPHTIEQFKTLFKDGMNFKQATIGKYWQLKVQVEACKLTSEVGLIHW